MNRTTTITAALAAAALAAGCESHNFVSPTAPQGPPPFIGPPEIAAPTASSAAAPTAPAATAAPSARPEPQSFYKTQDANDWIDHTFKLQPTYARVIAVTAGEPPAKVTVGVLDLKAGPAKEAAVELAVTATVKTLQQAADMALGGDLIAVLPGTYQGFTLGDKPEAGDGRYLHFKALGAPGEVVIDRATGDDPNWMVLLREAHHVIVEGFSIAGSNGDGKPAAGPNAGILINGNFLHSSKMSHHIAIVGNYSHHHKKWGFHSVDSHSVLIEDNLFAFSALEHGAYVSDGSDNYVVRRNVFFANAQSGLQCNLDATSSLEKLRDHPALEGHSPYKQSREWALEILAKATETFGANAFPDGRGFNFLIEENVVNENGRAGAGGLNLAGVRESLIQNNLLYDNQASGLVEWDNNNGFDRGQVDPGPSSPGEITGPESLPLFGCFSNVIRNNTVLSSVKSRPSLLVGTGSWGTRARNNILINDLHPSVELHATSIWRFDAARNIVNTVAYDGRSGALRSLAISLPDEGGSVVGVTRARLYPQLVAPSEEPWIVLDRGWWKLNPRRPDFRPRPTSPLLTNRGDPRELPRADVDGHRRETADIGCYAAAK